MRRDRQTKTPKIQPASAGGPPKPPKKTARGLEDQPPEHCYGYAIVLSLMFQVSAWVMCSVASLNGPPEISGGVLFNWRVWFISCAAGYWLGFVAVFLTRRQNPPVWRVLYTGLGFPALFIAAAVLVPRVYGAD